MNPVDFSANPQAQAYAQVAEAIAYLRAHAREQPTLSTLAAAMGLSPFHLQRLFSAWAGISPKRFLQVITRDHARRCLAASQDVLGAALASGLSGPGRLHDLLLACDAVTPGQVGARGEGLCIHHGWVDTPLGLALLGDSGRGICHFEFVDARDAAALAAAFARLQALWPQAEWRADPPRAQALAAQMFPPGLPAGRAPASTTTPLRLLLRGTNFQIKVWEALLQIPAGQLSSYGRLATAIGQSGAARAVGRAVGSNPLALLIPCHRVIRESGALGGYRWGLARKQALLAWEAGAGASNEATETPEVPETPT